MEPDAARRLCIQFSRFFPEKLERIADIIKTRRPSAIPLSAARRIKNLDTVSEFSVVISDEVAQLITLLPPKSSPLDCLPVSLLKHSVVNDVVAPLLAQLANLSFAAGTFSSMYKLVHAVPLLKKLGLDTTDPTNYRSITNLCTFSKVLEKLALARLPHILSCDNFSRFQPGYSTETALLKVVSDIRLRR